MANHGWQEMLGLLWMGEWCWPDWSVTGHGLMIPLFPGSVLQCSGFVDSCWDLTMLSSLQFSWEISQQLSMHWDPYLFKMFLVKASKQPERLQHLLCLVLHLLCLVLHCLASCHFTFLAFARVWNRQRGERGWRRKIEIEREREIEREGKRG